MKLSELIVELQKALSVTGADVEVNVLDNDGLHEPVVTTYHDDVVDKWQVYLEKSEEKE